jgi:DNA-binding SARP family transcriptional activator
VLEIRLFGELEITVDGEGRPTPRSRNARALLAELALKPGLHSRDEVAARFWADGSSASARVSLSTELTKIRRALGPAGRGYLLSTRDAVGLSPAATVDARQFDDHMRDGRWADAVAVWCGDMLQDTAGDRAQEIRQTYRARYGRALEALAAEAERQDDFVEAAEVTRRHFEVL